MKLFAVFSIALAFSQAAFSYECDLGEIKFFRDNVNPEVHGYRLAGAQMRVSDMPEKLLQMLNDEYPVSNGFMELPAVQSFRAGGEIFNAYICRTHFPSWPDDPIRPKNIASIQMYAGNMEPHKFRMATDKARILLSNGNYPLLSLVEPILRMNNNLWIALPQFAPGPKIVNNLTGKTTINSYVTLVGRYPLPLAECTPGEVIFSLQEIASDNMYEVQAPAPQMGVLQDGTPYAPRMFVCK